MKTAVFLLFGLSCLNQLSAQDNTISPVEKHGYPDRWLHRWEGPTFAQKEKSIGLSPSFQFLNGASLGLGISRGQFVVGEGGGYGFGSTVGVEYFPSQQTWAPKVQAWATNFAFIGGGTVGIGGMYLLRGESSNFVFLPEIGLSFLKMHLRYGYRFFLKDDFTNIGRHSLTLSYYHTFLPFR